MRTPKSLMLPAVSMAGIVAVATGTLAVGCATTGKTASAPPITMRPIADAVIDINGLS